ncbi:MULTISPECIES: protease complex subunit PrcB family protein [Bacillaceae]|nr:MULTISPECIES: protease complex subunit PrcB family protein [Bacillaceae]
MKRFYSIFSGIIIASILTACGQGTDNIVEIDSKGFGDLLERTERLSLPYYEEPPPFFSKKSAGNSQEDDEGKEEVMEEQGQKIEHAEEEQVIEDQDNSGGQNDEGASKTEEEDKDKAETEQSESEQQEEGSDDVRKDPSKYRVLSHEEASKDPDISDYIARLNQNTKIRGWNTVEYRGGTVLIVSAGERRTGGYSLNIVGASAEDGGIRVDIMEHEPAPDAMVTMALTNPLIVIEFPDVTPDQNWIVMDVKRGEPFPYWSNSSGLLK